MSLSRVTVQVNDACLKHVVSNFNYKPANVGTYKDCKYTKSTMIIIFFLVASPFSIGEEAGGGQGRDFINIHTAAQIAAIAVYITFGPPKMELLPMPMFSSAKLHMPMHVAGLTHCAVR